MLYEIRGYVFDKEGNPQELKHGITVPNYDVAQTLLMKSGFEHFLITLVEVKEGE